MADVEIMKEIFKTIDIITDQKIYLTQYLYTEDCVVVQLPLDNFTYKILHEGKEFEAISPFGIKYNLNQTVVVLFTDYSLITKKIILFGSNQESISFFKNVSSPNPTEPAHLATKAYVDSVITDTGSVIVGTGLTINSGVLSLDAVANSNTGTLRLINVDNYGRVSGYLNATASDISPLLPQPLSTASSPTFNRITITTTPSLSTDAATKAYVDGAAANISAGTGLTKSGNIISIDNTGVAAGTYKSVTVNLQGQVTSGSNPTTLSGYGITDALNTSGGTMFGGITFSGTSIITNGGTLGLGTNSPDSQARLHVNGNIRMGSTSLGVEEDNSRYITSGGQLFIQSNDSTSSNDSFYGLLLSAGTDSTNTSSKVDIAGSRTNTNNRFIDLYTSNTRRFRLADGGNIGIGNITNPTYKLTVDGVVAPSTDNNRTLGAPGSRWSEVYAGNGSINTSDLNYKQDIEDLSIVETEIARQIKGLIKKYRFKDAVFSKGNDARIHVGIIAQELERLFIDNGLDPNRYGMFCSDIWYEKEVVEIVKRIVENSDKNSSEKHIEVEEEIRYLKISKTPEDGYVKRAQLGIRYDELLCFIISAI